MNWEAVSAISEIFSAIAVIVTLIYLARQVAMSNRFAEADAWRSRFSEFTNINAAYGVIPSFHDGMMKLHQGCTKADLKDDEESLVDSFLISTMQIYEQLFREVRAGILDPAALDEFTGESGFHLPYFKEKWPVYRKIILPSFAKFMEEKFSLV